MSRRRFHIHRFRTTLMGHFLHDDCPYPDYADRCRCGAAYLDWARTQPWTEPSDSYMKITHGTEVQR